MVMLFLFPPVLLGALAVWSASAWKARSISAASPAAAVVLVALTLSYAFALAVISVYPWFDDNGGRQFIAWPYRWAWAAELAGWVAIPVVPSALGLLALARGMAGRRSGKDGG